MYLNPTPARAGARASSHSSSATTSGRAACPYRGQSQRTYVRRTASTLADELGRWLFEEGCDEFNIMVPYVPEGLDDFVNKALPSCGVEACSGANTRARRCEKISDCHGRRTRSSARRKIDPTGLSTPRPHVGHSTTAE